MRIPAPRRPLRATLALTIALVFLASGAGGSLQTSAAAVSSAAPPTGLLLLPDRPTASPIQHVIIIIQENHAFDNYYTQFSGAFGLPPGGEPEPTSYGNVTGYANQYALNWNYGSSSGNQSSSSPDHDVENIHQYEDNGTMDGYYYGDLYADGSADAQTSDGYFPSYIVANELGLAQEYGVADDYFHDYSGPTTPNRFYYYADTSGQVTTNTGVGSSEQTVTFPTLPDELTQNGISWGDFDGNYNENNASVCLPPVDWPDDFSCYFFTSLVQLMPSLYFQSVQTYQGQQGHLQSFENLYTDLYTNNLPAVSWYTQDWLNGTEHPGMVAGFGGNVTQGEEGILSIIRAVENSPYWSSTAIFLSYDEGGGFFDHTPPPQISYQGDGVRIPLVVISPYTKEGYVSHEYYTPSSLLAFIEWNWGIPALGALDGSSNIPFDFFNFSAPPRAALPNWIWAGSNLLTSYPWNYTQPVSAGLLGHYEPALLTQHNVTWADQTQNNILNSPALTADGKILYEVGMDGFVRAFDPILGTQEWAYSLGDASRSTPALLPNDGVLASTLHGGLTAYGSGGSLLWNLSLGAPIYGGLTLAQGNYYGGLTNGSAFEVSANGTIVWWKQVSQEGIYNPPAFDATDGMLMFSARSGGVVGVSLGGVIDWTAGVPGGVFATGAVQDGTLYVTSMTGAGIFPVNTSTGAIGSPGVFPGVGLTSPLIVGNTLYVSNSTGGFFTYALPSLTPGWTASLYCGEAGAPVEWNGQVVVVSEGGRVYFFNPTTGALPQIWYSKTSFYGGPISTAEGLYFGGEDGNLYAKVTAGYLHVSVTPTTATITVGGSVVPSPLGTATVIEPAGSVSVSASAPGYVTKMATPTVPAGGSAWVNLTLSPSGVKTGLVDVSLTPTAATLSVNGTAVPNQPTGSYSLPENPGPLLLSATESGYLGQSKSLTIVGGNTYWWNVTLVKSSPHPGTVEGVISNASTPSQTISGATVEFEPGSESVVSGAGGVYTTSLNPGSYSVFVNVSGYDPYHNTVTVAVAPPDSWLNVSLTPSSGPSPTTGTLEGTIYNGSASGPTLAGVEVLVEPSGQKAVSSAMGTFSFQLPGGTYSVFVNATNFDPFVANALSLTVGGTKNLEVYLTPVTTSPPGSHNSTVSGSNVDWLYWGLILALVVAAVVLVLAVVLHRRRSIAQGSGGAEVAAGGGVATAEASYSEAGEPGPGAPQEGSPVEAGEPPLSGDDVAPDPMGSPGSG